MDKIAIKGVSWNLLENILSFFIKFFIGIVLARLVSVEDYGIIGVASIFISFTDVLLNSGLGQAYVQMPDLHIKHANGLILVNLTISTLISILLWLCAPYIAIYFNINLLTEVIRWMTIVVILNSVNTIQIAHCRKIIRFKVKSMVNIGSSIISGSIGVYFAFKGLGIWCLVIQQITNRVLITIGLFTFTGWSFGFYLERKKLKEMLRLGKWAFGSNMVTLIFSNFYRFLFGKFLPIVQLSYYDRGQQFPSLLTQQLSWSFNMVALPHFVNKRDNLEELKDAHFRFIKYLMFILFPSLCFMFLYSDQIILFLLTKKWIMVAPIMRYLCVISLFIPFYDLNIQVFQTKLLNRFVFIIDTSRIILRILNAFLCLKLWGIYGILVGEVIISLINYIVIAYFSSKYIGYNFFSQIKYIKKIIITTLISLVLTFPAVFYIHEQVYLVIIVFLLFASIYYLIMRKMDKIFFIEAKELFVKKA